MFAVRDNRTKKFLRDFSGSLNMFYFHVGYKLGVSGAGGGGAEIAQRIHDHMWSLDDPNDAKLYRTKGSIASSFHCYRTKGSSLEESLPWLEIVEVKISVANPEPATEIHVIHSSNPEFEKFVNDKQMESLKDRTVKVEIPLLLPEN